MRLMQITYDVESGTVVRAVLEGNDIAKAVTVTFADGGGGASRGTDEEEQRPLPSPPCVPLSPAQVRIATALGYQEDDSLPEPEPEQGSVFDWRRGSRA